MSDKDRGRHWAPEWTEKLEQLFPTGMSFSRIAAEIGNGLTRNACIGKVHRMGLTRATHPKCEKRRRFKPIKGPRPARATFSLPPIEIEELRCAPVEPLHLRLADLTADQCRFPYGDGPFTFCGHHATSGSYCGGHHALCLHEAHRNSGRERLDSMRRMRRTFMPAVLTLVALGEDEAA